MDKRDSDGTDKFDHVPAGIQICNLGSSHGLRSFCYDNIDAKYTCFNFALTSQSLLYDEKILEYYKDNLAPNAVVFIPVSYFSLYGREEYLEEDFESKNQRYYNFLPPYLITNYDKLTGWLKDYPILTAYGRIVAVLLGSSKKPDLDAWTTQTADDIDLQENVQASFSRHLITDKTDENGNRIINSDNVNALYNMIEICNKIGARPVLLTTPFSKEYIEMIQQVIPEFFQEFSEKMNEIVTNSGVEYYDYSHDTRFLNHHNLFMDGDHLNETGAKIFVDILIEEVVLTP